MVMTKGIIDLRGQNEMDNKRIDQNIKNLEMAKRLMEIAFEDLKNIKGFRESQEGNLLYREKILAMLQAIIAKATAVKRSES